MNKKHKKNEKFDALLQPSSHIDHVVSDSWIGSKKMGKRYI